MSEAVRHSIILALLLVFLVHKLILINLLINEPLVLVLDLMIFLFVSFLPGAAAAL